ncbi:hypothetical protein FACS1894201_03800 [Bacteroidia bacterium]|nr:hypothetical protein FACS1894201_03800 [Bacteroidia bacterium]
MQNRSNYERVFVQQHDETDCGVACLLSLVHYYGGDTTLGHLRKLSGTSTTGTTLLGLYQAADKMGFDVQGCESDIKGLVEHGKPVILHIIVDKKFEHYVICYGIEDGQFIISDPAKEVSLYSEKDLSAVWTGKCLTLEPNKNFIAKERIKKEKWEWIKTLMRADIGILSVSVFLGIILAILGVVMAVFSQKLIDEVLPNKNMQKLVLGLALVTLLLLARLFMQAIRQRLLITQSKNFNNRIIDFFYKKLLRLPKIFFDSHKTGDMVARLNDTRRIQGVISSVLGSVVIDSLVALVSLCILAYYSWQIAIIAILTIPVFFAVIYAHNTKILKQQREVMSGYAATESNFINTINGITTIKNFNRETIFQTINQQLYALFQNTIYNLGTTQIKIGMLSGIVGLVIMMSIIAYSTIQVI